MLKKINHAKIGDIIINPTKTGKRKIKVTRLLKTRSVLALTLKISKKKKPKRFNMISWLMEDDGLGRDQEY